MLCRTQCLVFIFIPYLICGSVYSQTICSQKTDKNAFHISDVDLLCDLSLNKNVGKPKLIEKIFSGFDFQRLGSDNSWVLRFRDRFGKVRSLVISNLEKGQQLMSYPRKVFGSFDQVIGDKGWNQNLVKHSIGKLLTSAKKVDFDVRPPAITLSFADIWRSIWKPKSSAIQDMKNSAEYLTYNKKKTNKNINNRELFAKSMAILKKPENIYDKQYLEIISKINEMSNAIQRAEKQMETKLREEQNYKITKTDKTEHKISNNTLSEDSVKKYLNKKYNKKGVKLSKFQIKNNKNPNKISKIGLNSFGTELTKLIPSETDRHLLNSRSHITVTESSPLIKRISLSVANGMSANSKIYSPHKLNGPKIAPPTPMISPTSVLSLPIDFAQTILAEPTSDIDTFTYRDALIGDESQILTQLSKDNELSYFTNFDQ